jgi:hypothetical protein
MKCSLKLVTAFLALLFVNVRPSYPQATAQPKTQTSKADTLPSVDEIAAKCAKGSGGKEAWAKISTVVMTGTMEIPAAGLTGKVEITSKAPNKALRVISLADGQFVQKQAFDGRVGWKSDPQTGLKQLEGAELEGAKLEAIFDTEIRFKEIYPDMKVTGRTKVGERDAYTVLAHEPGGKAVTFYFDTESGLRIAEDSEGPDDNGNMVKSTVFFEDYRAVGGVQTAYRIRVTSQSLNLAIQIQEVNINVPVNDSIFAMPASDAAAPAKP